MLFCLERSELWEAWKRRIGKRRQENVRSDWRFLKNALATLVPLFGEHASWCSARFATWTVLMRKWTGTRCTPTVMVITTLLGTDAC